MKQKKKMTFGRRLLVGVLVFFGLLVVVEAWLSRRWGADVDVVKIELDGRAFEASRDEVGAWKIVAERDEDLWFAFGYLQGLDRDFQLELMRRMARGELAGWMGAGQLERDVILRASSRVARDEWERLSPGSRERRSAEAFVAGLNRHRRDPLGAEIFESRFLPVKRAELPAWEAWEVLAVARLHAWEFSYDYGEELRALRMQRNLGADLARLLLPSESAASPSLYGQSARPELHSSGPRGTSIPAPEAFVPVESTASWPSLPSGEKLALNGEEWEREARPVSNAWILSEPKTALPPTLCNDPHLSTAWPAPLYPIRYEVRGLELKGTGFMLPGVPVLAIGTVERGAAAAKTSLSWGITLATFADVQDLVTLSPETLGKAQRRKENFEIRDPLSGKVERKEIELEWTEHGLRVDPWLALGETAPLALDWIGFRRSASPLGFLLDRSLDGLEGLDEGLANRWVFPAVNYTWISRRGDAPTRGGHVLTGLLYERERPEVPRRPLSEAEARARKLSRPSERPHVEGVVEGKSIFFATGNQRVYDGKLGVRVATDWYDGARAERILSQKEKTLSEGPEWSQTDFHSPAVLEFVRLARARLNADRLCAEGDASLRTGCQLMVGRLDAWDGEMAAEDWVPTVAMAWFAQARKGLWGAAGDGLESTKEGEAEARADSVRLHIAWQRTSASYRALRNFFRDEKARKAWEKTTGRDFDDTLASSFGVALQTLLDQLGPIPEQWLWGDVHRVQWAHPLAMLPNVGDWMGRGLFGDRRVGGGVDSPGRMDSRWDPRRPAAFPTTHAAVMRSCVSFGPTPGETQIRWASLTGPSGNPLSRWARVFPDATYFRGKLAPVLEGSR